MEKENFYDYIICFINPDIKEIDIIINIMNRTRSKFKIVACSSSNTYVGSKRDEKLDFFNNADKKEEEYSSLRYCFENFFSSSYFLIRHGDSIYNLKYLIAYSSRNKFDFILVNEDKKYYDRLFDKLYYLNNNKFTVGSCYLFASYKFLKLFYKMNSKKVDFTQNAVKMCLKYPEIKSDSLNIKGPLSKVSERKTTKLKIKFFFSNSFFISSILNLLLIIRLFLSGFNPIVLTITLINIFLISALITLYKKIYYKDVYNQKNNFKRRK